MSPLEHLQQQFLGMIIGDAPLTFGVSRIGALQSQRIYRRNYRENHVQSLAGTYTRVVTLVGDDYFRQLGWRYLAAHPGASGDLNDYGAHFPAFLEQLLPQAPGGERLPYLPDMARLDWACIQALRAPCGNPHALAELARWPPQHQGSAGMRLHPACTLLLSRFPLHRLWRLAEGEALTVDLDAGGEAVLVSRPAQTVQVTRLDAATTCLLQQWQTQPLAASLQQVAAHHPDTDITRLLPTLLPLGVIGELYRSHP